ncbi:MAG: TlpA family protein disulfide reductase [SAR324 cluster bacterium]|nr:TlpA family protein disulfide reductase [SAR324 cluster bacterium]
MKLFKIKSYLVAGLVLLGSLVVLWFMWQKGDNILPSEIKTTKQALDVLVDKGFYIYPTKIKLPNLSFMDVKGNNKNLAMLMGDYNLLLINLWQIGCPPCLEEMPQLDSLSINLAKDKIKVLMINYGDQISNQQDFLTDYPYALEFWSDVELASESFLKTVPANEGIYGLPQTYLIDASGNFVAALFGIINWDDEHIKSALTKLATSKI